MSYSLNSSFDVFASDVHDLIGTAQLNAHLQANLDGGDSLIVNGAMVLAQEQTSGTLSNDGGGFLSADMFRSGKSGSISAVFNVSNDASAPSGFSNATKWQCTTAQTTLLASDSFFLETKVEAQRLQHFKYGQTSALVSVIQFRMISKKTGTYTVWIYQADGGRSTQAQYTIDQADTWELKSFLIPADPHGTINNDNGEGLRFVWCMGAGTNFTSGLAPSAWEDDLVANRFAGQTVNLADSTDNYMLITAVQYDPGSVVNNFRHVDPWENELACRWQFRADLINAVSAGWGGDNHEYLNRSIDPPMRATPSVSRKGEWRDGRTPTVDGVSSRHAIRYSYPGYFFSSGTVTEFLDARL